MTEPMAPPRPAFADALTGTRHVFIRELKVDTYIGVYDHEKQAPQPIIISIDMTVRDGGPVTSDDLADVVCYEKVTNRVRQLCRNEDGHVNLVETLAERIAGASLVDPRVLATRVRIEKPDAINDCRSVGIEIERLQARD